MEPLMHNYKYQGEELITWVKPAEAGEELNAGECACVWWHHDHTKKKKAVRFKFIFAS